MRSKRSLTAVLCMLLLLCQTPANAVPLPSPIDFEETANLDCHTLMIVVDGDWTWNIMPTTYERFVSFVENTGGGKASDDTALKITIENDKFEGLKGNTEVRPYMDLANPLSLEDHEWVISYQVMISDYTAEVKNRTAGYHFGTFKADGKIYGGADADQEIGVWEPNRWYTVTVVMPAFAAEGDFYIDNVKVDGKVGLRAEAATTAITASDIHIYPVLNNGAASPGEVYIDNLYFEDLGKGTGLFRQPASEIAGRVGEMGGSVVENPDGGKTVYVPNHCKTAGEYLAQLGEQVKLYRPDGSGAIAPEEYVGGRALVTEALKYGLTENYELLPYVHMAEVQYDEDTGKFVVRMKNAGAQAADSWLWMAAYQGGLLSGWERQKVTAGAGAEQELTFSAGVDADEINIWMVDGLEQTTPQLCSWVYKK